MGAPGYNRLTLTQRQERRQEAAELEGNSLISARVTLESKLKKYAGMWSVQKTARGDWWLRLGPDPVASCGFGEQGRLYAELLRDAMKDHDTFEKLNRAIREAERR